MKKHSLRFTALFMFVAVAAASGCASPGKKTAIGAGVGAGAGAAVGAIAGGGKGALIGAGVGAAMGGIVGNRLDKQAQELEKVAETKRTDEGILLNMKNDLLFATGSSTLSPAAQNQIAQIAAIIVKYPTDILTISGHTDSTGSASTNQTLSIYRARAVQSALVAAGVPPNQITTQGFGESQPIASNSTAKGRAQNRRVEIVITDSEAKKQE